MGKRSSRLVDFVIDKLTNSIENAVTGEVFDTEIVRLTAEDVKLVIRKDWQFNWRKEIRDTGGDTIERAANVFGQYCC